MATFAAERPQFFEGQYLGAADLEAIVAYLRTSDARQNLGQHSWGVACGLNLVSSPISDTAVEYFVQPGVAIDGYGRLIVVQSPTRLDPAQLSGSSSGLIDVWIRYDQGNFMATRPGFGTCTATDDYARINEGFRIVFGSKASILEREGGVVVNEALIQDAREALISVDPEAPLLLDGAVPHQEFPTDDETALWLIPLGHVRWSGASNSFLPLVDPAEVEALANGNTPKSPDQVYEALMQGRAKRRLIGVVAESLFAVDGLIRLRERTVPTNAAQDTETLTRAQAVQSRDLHVCNGQLKPKELVWLEGNVRVEGDARLLNGRLEFRDGDGRDYIQRTVDGAFLSASTPLLFQRQEQNPHSGVDLQLLLGRSTNGRNRFTVGNVEFSGKDLCNLTTTIEARIVFQDDGKLGIGTVAPDTELKSPLTIRGLTETITVNPGTPEQDTYNIYRVATFENADGGAEWQVDLWDKEGVSQKSLSFSEANFGKSCLFLESNGRVGIGTTAPVKPLHLKGDSPTVFVDINESSPQHRAELQFGKEGAVTSGLYWNKSNNALVMHYGVQNALTISPTLMQIRHGDVDALTIQQHKVGIGTPLPMTNLHVASGPEVTFSPTSGYVIIGNTSAAHVAYDANNIQARLGAAASPLVVQPLGGAFIVHASTGSQFRVDTDGDVGIGTSTPQSKLDVRGDIRFGDAGQLYPVAGRTRMRLLSGRVGVGGNLEYGNGFTALRSGTGIYNILFDAPFSDTPIVVATPYSTGNTDTDNIAMVASVSESSCQIRICDIVVGGTSPANGAFTFIVSGPR